MINNYGFSVRCPGEGSNLDLGTINNLFEKTNGAWSMITNLFFVDDVDNTFFGNAGDGSRVLYLKRNADGTSRIQIIDANGNKREVVWESSLIPKKWYLLKIVSLGEGDGNLKLFIGPSEQVINSQTHDIGFNPDTSFSLRFGEVEEGVTGEFNVTKTYFYERALSDAELDAIDYGTYPNDFSSAFNFDGPNIGV